MIISKDYILFNLLKKKKKDSVGLLTFALPAVALSLYLLVFTSIWLFLGLFSHYIYTKIAQLACVYLAWGLVRSQLWQNLLCAVSPEGQYNWQQARWAAPSLPNEKEVSKNQQQGNKLIWVWRKCQLSPFHFCLSSRFLSKFTFLQQPFGNSLYIRRFSSSSGMFWDIVSLKFKEEI